MEHHRLLQHDIASEGVCITIVTELVRLLPECRNNKALRRLRGVYLISREEDWR